MCSRRVVTISTNVTSEENGHPPLLGLKTCINFQTINMRQKWRKKSSTENSPARRNPSTPEGWDRTPSKSDSHSHQSFRTSPRSWMQTPHKKAFVNSVTNLKPRTTAGMGPTKTQEKLHQCSRSLCYRALVKWNSQMILGSKLSPMLQRWEEKIPFGF